MYYLFVGTFTVLLLYQRPLVLSAKALANGLNGGSHRRAFDDDGIEEIIENLVRQANGRSQGGREEDLEIDLAPPEEYQRQEAERTNHLQIPSAPNTAEGIVYKLRDTCSQVDRHVEAEDFESVTDDSEEEDQDDSKSESAAGVKKRSEELKGEGEFITFVNPDPKPNLRLSDKSVVEVKRTPKGTSVFSTGAVASVADIGNTMFVATITACVVAAVFGLVVAGIVFRRIHKQHEAAREASYPQYGGTGPAIEKKSKQKQKAGTASGDANLAYSAQLHHFNQTKQKIISTETPACESRGQESEDSEGEGEEGDYSVYECPGLAPTGDIEVSNPLFENNSPKSKDAPGSDLSEEKQGTREGD